MGEEYLFLKFQEEYVTTKAKRIIAPIIINIIRLNPLTKVGNKSLNISIAAGMFNKPTNLKTYSNIFTQGKLDYYKLDTRLKNFAKYSK